MEDIDFDKYFPNLVKAISKFEEIVKTKQFDKATAKLMSKNKVVDERKLTYDAYEEVKKI